jgi:hypothetical protein
MIDLFLHHLPRVRTLAEEAGPYVYHLTRDRLVKMTLDCSSE